MGSGGKKKHQKGPFVGNEETEVSSDDEGGGGGESGSTGSVDSKCPHVGKGVNISNIKKATKASFARIGVCGPCAKEKRAAMAAALPPAPNKPQMKKSASAPVNLTSAASSPVTNGGIKFETGNEIFMCLKCGIQSCGSDCNPTAESTHVKLHYTIPRSELHCISLNLNSFILYCHQCHKEVYLDSYKKVREAVELVKKLKATKGVSAPASNKPKSSKSATLFITKNPVNGTLMAQQLPKVRGLTNLGNTCFFNAVIQCLSQSHPLTHVIDRHCQKNAPFCLPSIPSATDGAEILEACQLQLMESGPITLSLAAFLKEMNSHGKNGVYNPGHLFGQVCRRSPQFRGYHQEDAHELLRQLLEGLRTEEVKRQKSAILKMFGLSEKTDPKTVAPNIKKKLQALGRHGNYTIVDKLFGGQLVSTIVCEQCHNSSQIYEAFLDISLPLIEEKTPRPLKNNNSLNCDVDSVSISCFGKSSNSKSKKEKQREKKEKRKNKKNLKKNKQNTVVNEEETAQEPENVSEESSKPEVENNLKLIENIAEMEEPIEVKEEDKSHAVDTKKKSNTNNVVKKVIKKDGNEEDSEEDDDEEEDNDYDWEWDVDESSSKTNGQNEEEEEDDEVEEIEEISNKPLVSLNPISPELIAEANREGSSEREKSSVEKDLFNEDEETGASSNGDVEDNCEQQFHPDSQHLDPHMEQLCRKVRRLSVATTALEVDHSQREYSITSGVNDDEEEEEENEDSSRQSRLQNDWIARSLTSIAPRYTSSAGECSIYSCLTQFTAPELLTGNNKWACDKCTKMSHREDSDPDHQKIKTVYSNASKQIFIFCPPAVLTIHLKRFQQTMTSLRKINKHVGFPINLNLAPFVSSTSISTSTVDVDAKSIDYYLFGVVEHSGRLQGGHYTAFVKVRPSNMKQDFQRFYSNPTVKSEEIQSLLQEIERKLKEAKNKQQRVKKAEEKQGEEEEEKQVNETSFRWYHVSDSSVSEVTEEKVLKSQAYILFYERFR